MILVTRRLAVEVSDQVRNNFVCSVVGAASLLNHVKISYLFGKGNAIVMINKCTDAHACLCLCCSHIHYICHDEVHLSSFFK